MNKTLAYNSIFLRTPLVIYVLFMLCMIPGVEKSITFRDIREFLHSHHIYLYHIVVYFLRFIAYCLLLILLMHVSVNVDFGMVRQKANY